MKRNDDTTTVHRLTRAMELHLIDVRRIHANLLAYYGGLSPEDVRRGAVARAISVAEATVRKLELALEKMRPKETPEAQFAYDWVVVHGVSRGMPLNFRSGGTLPG